MQVRRRELYFIHHSKDHSGIWMVFGSKDSAEAYMNQHGGRFDVRQGVEFNNKWIDEVISEVV
jgi:hypothetical protein